MGQNDQILTNIAKMRGYIATYLGVKGPLNARQRAALQTDLKTLDNLLAQMADAVSATSAPAVAVAPAPESNPATDSPDSPYTAGQANGPRGIPSGIPLTNPVDQNAEHDREMAIFIPEQDKLLIAAGKPAGHGGDERGALPLETNIALAQSLNLPLLVAEFESMRVPGAGQ